jgi:hypothetical protein
MDSMVMVEIDQLGGFPRRANRCFPHCVLRARECDDAAMMIGIGLPAEQQHVGHGCNRVDNCLDLGEVAAFRKIGYALDHV